MRNNPMLGSGTSGVVMLVTQEEKISEEQNDGKCLKRNNQLFNVCLSLLTDGRQQLSSGVLQHHCLEYCACIINGVSGGGGSTSSKSVAFMLSV